MPSPRVHFAQHRKTAGFTQESLAEALHVDRSTVSRWELGETAPQPSLRPRIAEELGLTLVELAMVLSGANAPAALIVAVAVVRKRSDVLIVRRREGDPSGIIWQFPAGIVKPGGSAEQVAVTETLAETGVHCRVGASLGTRRHPLSGVVCSYFLCEYLAGEAKNCDPSENAAVTWIAVSDVTRFIPQDQIYSPLLSVLESADESAT